MNTRSAKFETGFFINEIAMLKVVRFEPGLYRDPAFWPIWQRNLLLLYTFL